MASKAKYKCFHCGEWSLGEQFFCPDCGEIRDEASMRKVAKEREEKQAEEIERAKDEARTPFMRSMVRIGRAIETAYIAFIGFIAWVIAWVAG